MLEELKRCNSVGDYKGLLFLLTILSGKEKEEMNSLLNRCSIEKGISVKFPGALAFLDYLGYVRFLNYEIFPTEKLDDLLSLNDSGSIFDQLIKDLVSILVSDNLFDSENISFDIDSGKYVLKCATFPLAYAAIRNFLLSSNVLLVKNESVLLIPEKYETIFSTEIRKTKQKLSLEELRERQEKQNLMGLIAEEFVLTKERKRLPKKAIAIKRISDIDVSAGYDIISFMDETSVGYDKLIEVKSFIGNPHFYWSENEINVAKRKGKNYYLCLVDYEKIHDEKYEPEYVQDPYTLIFKNEGWAITPTSFKVDKI